MLLARILQILIVLSILSAFVGRDNRYLLSVVLLGISAFLQGSPFGILYKIYLLANVLVFLVYSMDKSIAISNGSGSGKHQSRVPENSLIILSVFGIFGAIAAIIGLNHKVNKLKFQIYIPIITIIEVALYSTFFNL